MNSDLIFYKKQLIGICDMSQFIIGKTIKERKIVETDRKIVEIPVQEFKNILINKGITREMIEYNFSRYIENRQYRLDNNLDYISEDSLKQGKEFFNKYKTLNQWRNEIEQLIKLKAKPEFSLCSSFDFEFENKILVELSEKNEIQKFLLNGDLSWDWDKNYSDSLYNIPFLSDYELFYLLLENESKGNIIVDITDRLENMNYTIQNELYKKKTFHRTKFDDECDEVLRKIEKGDNDNFIAKMLLGHLITMFESYIRNIIRTLINNKNFYLRKVVENDFRFYSRRKNVSYKDLFSTIDTLKKQLNKFINENSFQSVDIIKIYLIDVFNIYKDENQDEFKKIIEKYDEIVKKRNLIIHSNGIYKDGKSIEINSEELQEYYSFIKEVIKRIDEKIFISLCYM